MSDTQPNDDPVVNPDPVVEDVNKPVDSIPYSRFKEVNDALKSANEALAEMKKSQEKVRTKELEEKEEWKTLADERQAKIDELNAKATEWDEFQANRRKALIEKLPEDDREVYGVLPLEKLEIHVEKITNSKMRVDTSESELNTNVDRNKFRKKDIREQRNSWGDYIASFKK